VGEAAFRGLPVVHSRVGALSEVALAGVADPHDPACYAAPLGECQVALAVG
jgi:hypothetical protein